KPGGVEQRVRVAERGATRVGAAGAFEAARCAVINVMTAISDGSACCNTIVPRTAVAQDAVGHGQGAERVDDGVPGGSAVAGKGAVGHGQEYAHVLDGAAHRGGAADGAGVFGGAGGVGVGVVAGLGGGAADGAADGGAAAGEGAVGHGGCGVAFGGDGAGGGGAVGGEGAVGHGQGAGVEDGA